MSVVVTVAAAGMILAPNAVFTAICTSAAVSMGLQLMNQGEIAAREEERRRAEAEERARRDDAASRVEVSVAAEAALQEVVAERCELTFGDEAVQITIRRDIRGRVSVYAHGDGMSRAELGEKVDQMLGLIRQQVAYRAVVKKMKEHGMEVAEESRAADGTARVVIKRRRS